jgi:hypothetical protein
VYPHLKYQGVLSSDDLGIYWWRECLVGTNIISIFPPNVIPILPFIFQIFEGISCFSGCMPIFFTIPLIRCGKSNMFTCCLSPISMFYFLALIFVVCMHWYLWVMGMCNTWFFWRWVVHIYNIGPYYDEGLVVVIMSNMCRASEICGGSKWLKFWNVVDMFVSLGLECERGWIKMV